MRKLLLAAFWPLAATSPAFAEPVVRAEMPAIRAEAREALSLPVEGPVLAVLPILSPAGQTIQATELVHEAWIRLYGNDLWQNHHHFLATAARTMRRILTDRARRKSRIKRGGDFVRVGLTSVEGELTVPEDQVLLIDEAIKRLENVDPLRARVVVLKFFGDMSNQEVAKELGVTERSVERYWAFAKAWLFREVNKQL